MRIEAENVKDYLEKVPEDRKIAVKKLYETISKNLPKGFQENISYGMMGWAVALETYPSGYHCTPNTPLPFIGMASQKNSINFYHMGIYSDPQLYNWFVDEFPKHSARKLDMGKSCVRFKKIEDIPYDLIGELVKKMSPKQWIEIYEKNLKK